MAELENRKRNQTPEVSVKSENETFIELSLESAEYLETDTKKFDKMCLICLNVKPDLISLFDRNSEGTLVLADVFSSVTSIELLQEDGLPTNLCSSCKEQIINCYYFKNQCVKSYFTLKTILKEDLIVRIKHEDDSHEWQPNPENQETETNLKNEEDVSYEDTLFLEADELEISNDCDEQINEYKSDFIRKPTKSKVPKNFNSSKLKQSSVKWYTCLVCSKRFKKLKTLKVHVKLKHESKEKQFSCKSCKETFILKRDLDIHSALHAVNGKWECNECHKVFSEKKQLKRHISRHMAEKKYKCDQCDKAFSELYALGRHRRIHTGETVEKKHACHICNKRYVDSSALRIHVQGHTGERPCECAVCGKAFPTPRLLRSHMLTHDDTKSHKCNYCEKRFRHESTRNTHHRTHTGEKPYVCSACGKTFIQSSNLTLHMRTHSGEKPYTCGSCCRKFSSWSSLKTHERTHTGEKPYSCDICGKRFARMDLRAHMRRHTGEAPFVCEVCNKRFTTRIRLRDHKRVHTGEKPFECGMCDQKYSTKSQLLKHIKTHKAKKNEKSVEKERNIQLNKQKVKLNLMDNTILKKNEHVKVSAAHITQNNNTRSYLDDSNENITNNSAKEEMIQPKVPMEVTAELELEEECSKELKTEIVLVDDLSDINVINNSIHLQDNTVNLVTVNENGVSTSQGTMAVECARVKLYQFDQNLLQIHTSGSELTISKIASKMAFE